MPQSKATERTPQNKTLHNSTGHYSISHSKRTNKLRRKRKMKKERIIEVQPVRIEQATVLIEGDGDLVLNKMNARTVRELTAARDGKKTIKEVPNIWEDIITAIHWRDGYPCEDTYRGMTEETLRDMLANNAPCITGFGLKKSFCQAVVRNEIDTYATKFDNAMNVTARLEPIKFAEHFVDKTLMSPKRGAPVLVYINRFSGWSSQIHITYTENVYSLDQIVNIINMAGFGLGIGSGRSSGYGRYHVVDVK
jgi:hypothetical protein